MSEGQRKRFSLTPVWNKGKTLSEKTKAKMSLAARNRAMNFISDDVKRKISSALIGRKLSDSHKLKLRLASIQNPNSKFSNTSIERSIAAELVRRGFVRDRDFFQNTGISCIANVDFYLPARRIIIECDGCYWHNCPDHRSTCNEEISKSDRKKTEALQKNGFTVYRFWEHEINTSSADCIDKVLN